MKVNKDFLCHFGELPTPLAALEIWVQGSILTAFLPLEGGREATTGAKPLHPTMPLCCSQAEAMCRAPETKQKAKHDAKNNSALRGASGPEQECAALCLGLQAEIWPFPFAFPVS